MLAFIVPLKSARVSQSWESVSTLVNHCLRSVLRQTTDQFRVIVVCHELPLDPIEHPNLTFIQVDDSLPEWDMPATMESEYLHMQRKRIDGSRKKLVGILAAREMGANYIMNVDADDFVSNRLAQFVLDSGDNKNGWYVNSGFEYVAEKYFFPIPMGFHKKCGTSHIINIRKFEEYSAADIPTTNGFFLAHAGIVDKLEKEGYLLEPLPFPGAVYCMEHGENIYAVGSKHRQWAKGVRMQTLRRILSYRIKTTFYRRVPSTEVEVFGMPLLGDGGTSSKLRTG